MLLHIIKDFIIHLAPNGLTTAKHRSTGCIDKYLPCLSMWSDILAAYTSPEIVSLKFPGCLVYAYIEGLLPVSAVGWDNQYVWALAFSRNNN